MRGTKARKIRKYLRDNQITYNRNPKLYRSTYKKLKKESKKSAPEFTCYPSKRDIKKWRKRKEIT